MRDCCRRKLARAGEYASNTHSTIWACEMKYAKDVDSLCCKSHRTPERIAAFGNNCAVIYSPTAVCTSYDTFGGVRERRQWVWIDKLTIVWGSGEWGGGRVGLLRHTRCECQTEATKQQSRAPSATTHPSLCLFVCALQGAQWRERWPRSPIFRQVRVAAVCAVFVSFFVEFSEDVTVVVAVPAQIVPSFLSRTKLLSTLVYVHQPPKRPDYGRNPCRGVVKEHYMV